MDIIDRLSLAICYIDVLNCAAPIAAYMKKGNFEDIHKAKENYTLAKEEHKKLTARNCPVETGLMR